MKPESILSAYTVHPVIKEIAGLLKQKGNPKIHLQGLTGSVKAFSLTSAFNNTDNSHWFVMPDKESAIYLVNDIENILNQQQEKIFNKTVLFFPSSFKNARSVSVTDSTSVLLRTEVLNRSRKNKKLIVVTYPEALLEQVISESFFEKNTLRLELNQNISVDLVIETLTDLHFDRVDYVFEPGQFAVRGGIVDVYSYSDEYPFRIEFFGDDVESIRTFDPATQLSVSGLQHIKIVPDSNNKELFKKRIPLTEYVSSETVFWFDDTFFTFEILEKIYYEAKKFFENADNNPEFFMINEIFSSAETLKKDFSGFSVIETGKNNAFPSTHHFLYQTNPQPSFNKNFNLLIQQLTDYESKGYHNFIFSDSKSQTERLEIIIEDILKTQNRQAGSIYNMIGTALHEGFIDDNLKICCFTDHQIFNRYHRFRLKENFKTKEVVTLKEIYNLQPGDFITHIDHGIGRYGGLEKIEINGKFQEAIRLVYENNDLLYVSIHSLHRISKFAGKEGTQPKLNRLGSNAWSNLKTKTKQQVKDIAQELIKLYAERKASQGHPYPPDNYLQHELEASFIFQDTPDQVKATEDVKKDMQADFPMDRLICGDVGFGKTEIAVRAAFKAVTDSKQVAVLVPTTILALQHYKTFSERLYNFPCSIEYINRFRTAKQQKEILQKLKNGQIDILIGTHRLISRDVVYKDLGLLIIDEEQKFGVAAKEKLRKIKVNVDTLTLTATPIPRTLQFSLMGARDLSVIQTPPPNRYPIQTQLAVFHEEIIRDAINYEISRGGQVFFVHNRIQNIQDLCQLINKLCPEARVAIGHGQLEGHILEQIMLDFIEGQFDVLVSTTIIESGLDIPNVNTIIINEAHHYGLSDLHQLRGRVGRSNRKAFCYLLSPPLSILTQEARKRLKTLEEFSELGSGFNIALRDLDIRGAGDILGAQQSGFISEIGFEMYQKILDEALFELRQTKNDNESAVSEPVDFTLDCQIETDMEVLIPDQYVSNISERLALYKELDNIENETELLAFRNRLTDRFGNVPGQVDELINTVRIRKNAKRIGFEKIILKDGLLRAYFISNPESHFYQSHLFQAILSFLAANPKFGSLKEANGKLQLIIKDIKKVAQGLDHLEPLLLFIEPEERKP